MVRSLVLISISLGAASGTSLYTNSSLFDDCPGGSLKACLALCPQSPASAFEACSKECVSRCSGGTPTPAPPAPTPAPPTPAPPGPTPSDCPGGSLKACLALCPQTPASAFEACSKECVSRCSGGTPTPAPPAPTPAPPTPAPPAPTPSDCPGGSLKACLALCPQNPASAFEACSKECVSRCSGGTPTPAPPAPTPAPPTPAPPAPTPPTPSGSCADVFQQCGGDPTQGYKGPTCCDTGCTCKFSSQFYSQCLPPSGKETCR